MSDAGQATPTPPQRASDPPLATLRVGIALGTQRTSVAASNGAREYFGSLVGWPRSAAARKLVGADVLVGAEAWRFRLAADLARPFEGGVVPGTGTSGSEAEAGVHARAVADLVRRAVKLARAAPGERVAAVLAVPARAARLNRDLLLRAAAESLVPLDVVPEAWAAWRSSGAPEGAIVVDVGAGETAVCRCFAEPPAEEDMVVIGKGGDAIDADLLARLRARLPAGDFTVGSVRELKERYGCLLDADTALVGLPVGGRTAPVDVAEAVAGACRAVVPAIVEAIRTLARRAPKEPPLVILAGCGGQLRGLDRMLSEEMRAMGGGRVERVGDPLFAGAEGALLRTTPR